MLDGTVVRGDSTVRFFAYHALGALGLCFLGHFGQAVEKTLRHRAWNQSAKPELLRLKQVTLLGCND